MDRLLSVIVSDLHLGSPHSLAGVFTTFVTSLPDGVGLILNGDTLDWYKPRSLPEEHEAVLDLLRRESRRRPVVWVRGNHDELYMMPSPGAIGFVNCHAVGRRLFVSHGFDFDNIMPKNRMFMLLFRTFHRIRLALGAEAVHVARYAKKFGPLYRVLCRHVAANAAEYAREQGFEAVTCGHTHFAEDTMVDGVRYINTGAWTERPLYCLAVYERSMRLAPAEGATIWQT